MSRQELEAFAKIKNVDELESYLQSIELPRVQNLMEDLSNGWSVVFQHASSKDFILAWSYAFQKHLSDGEKYFYGIELSNVLRVFTEIVAKDYRYPLGWSSGPVDAVEKWLECGNLDDLVYRLVLDDFIPPDFYHEKRFVISKIGEESDLSRMLAGGYFLHACNAINSTSEGSIKEWLINLDVKDKINDCQLWELIEFIVSDFVTKGYADHLIDNKNIQKILKTEKRLLDAAKRDPVLQLGINRLTGVV
ncbi:hypothetical protein [Vogesella mureinivorans]|uniref:hypothetical protein n=1 Tax=Vogesella mureinivorans TaxID=657276 RepID=UPI0011CB8610|nr:hypothetical protein [Vogesella mureinivorans]